MNKKLMHFSGHVVIVSMLSMSIWMPAAQAGMISSEQMLASQNYQHERDRLHALFDRADVRKQLLARGVDTNAAQARVDALTDSEVVGISGQLGSLPAGGDASDDLMGYLLIIIMMWLVAMGIGLI